MFWPLDDAVHAGLVFVSVNLLGLAAIALRCLGGWVIAGFQPEA